MDIISWMTINSTEISFFFILTAFVLGVLHALEPGHGKSVMAAFVMGTDASVKDASLLGLTIVFSHVFVVILLGLASIFLLGILNVNSTHEIMSFVGGIILIVVGVWMIKKFHHPHNHEHNIDTKKGVVAIGLSTGLIPCPTALAVLLFSISNGQIYNGLIYVLIFSSGLAIAITFLSVFFVKGRGFIQRYLSSSTVNKIPLVSGIIIIIVGIYTFLQPIIENLQ